MKKIVMGFSRPKKSVFPLFSWLIRAVEKTSYSHCYVRWYSETYDEPLVYEASGTTIHFVGQDFWMDHVTVIHEFELDVSDEHFHAIVKFCMHNAGQPYSILQAAGIALYQAAKAADIKLGNIFKNDRTAWVCSEHCGYLLRLLGYDVSEDLDLVGPRDIYEVVSNIPNARRL
jgi:hypothetical protein